MSSHRLSRSTQLQAFAGSGRVTKARGFGQALAAFALLTLVFPSAATAAGFRKLDPELNRRASLPGNRTSQVVVQLAPGADLPASLRRYVRGAKLALIDGYVLSMPDNALATLDSLPQVASAHQDLSLIHI